MEADTYKKYVETLIANGQVIGKDEPVKPGATHRIVAYLEDGTPVIKRFRFSSSYGQQHTN